MQTTHSHQLSFDNTQIAFASKNQTALNRAYLLFSMMNHPRLVALGTRLMVGSLNLKLPVKGLIRSTIFRQFCGGETAAQCDQTIQELGSFRIGTILDYSVEGESSEKVFDFTEQETIRNIRKAAGSAHIPFAVFKVTGIGSREVLEKIQAGKSLTPSEEQAYQRLCKRLENICHTAWAQNVRLFIDAEETWIQTPIDQIVGRMMAKYNQPKAIVYNTYQMYVASKLGQLQQDLAHARANGYVLGIKLVRGAYMEKERERAAELNYPDPIQPDKASTDRDFDAALKLCVENIDHVALCAGSHNEKSNYLLAQLLDEKGIGHDDPRVYFAQLYGMSDHISYNLADAGYQVAKYVPYGPVEYVMPYLVRRAEENTAMTGQTSREYELVAREKRRRQEQRR